MAEVLEKDTVAESDATSKIGAIAELVRRLCIADGNAVVYGLNHPLSVRSIHDAYAFLAGLDGGLREPLLLTISEDRLVFKGFPVETRNAQVARLVKRLGKLHVNSLHFLPGITLEEFTGFHELLAMKESDIEAHGGVRKLLEMAGIAHVAVSGAAYVLIEEDQRVVDRRAQVVAPDGASGSADSDVVRYMLGEVLRESREKNWVLDRIKNDPRHMASLIADGIEKALAEGTKPSEHETIQTLIENIKRVGESLMDHQDTATGEGQTDIKDAVIELEKEIQSRARQLMTTEDSKRFVSEILSVVTTYSDQVKAKRITREFLKGESNLKTAERMLKKLAGKQETGEELLLRLRDLMLKEGLKEEDLHRLLQQAKPPARERRRRKPADEALRAGIAQRVKELGLDDTRHADAIARLTVYFENRLAEREKEFSKEAEKLSDSIGRHEQVLDQIAGGIVIWDADGQLEYLNDPARAYLKLEPGTPLGPEAMVELRTRTFPAPDIPPEEAEKKNWSVGVYRLLTSVAVLVTDDEGAPVGALVTLPSRP